MSFPTPKRTSNLRPLKDRKNVPATGTFICHVDDIDNPGARGFTRGTGAHAFNFFIVRKGDSAFAYVNECPHAFLPLNRITTKFLTLNEEKILCAAHAASFRIEDGLCTGGPCAGKALLPIPLNNTAGALFIAEN